MPNWQKEWVLLCPGPTASQYAKRVYELYMRRNPDAPRPQIMTCNAGFRLFEVLWPGQVPTAYVCIERPAVKLFMEDIRRLGKKGTDIWTWKSRLVEIGGPRTRYLPYNNTYAVNKLRQTNTFEHPQYSHLFCVGVTALQAILQEYRASRVDVLGMCGYDIEQLYDPACNHHPITPVDAEHCRKLNQRAVEYTAQMLPFFRTRRKTPAQIMFWGDSIHDPDRKYTCYG